MQRSFFIETHGCQMNLADSAMVEQLLLESGYRRALRAEEADVILLNTCTVRGHAEERIYGRVSQLRALREQRPQLVLGLLGCLARHRGRELFERLPYLDLALGPDAYRQLPELLAAAAGPRQQGPLAEESPDRLETYSDLAAGTRFEGSAAFVTVQRGCDRFCAYCIVPKVRGRERAVPPDAVLLHVRAQVDAGYREVVLLGQTVNSYRHGDTDFAALLRQVVCLEGLQRLRFLSPHPLGFGQELIDLIASEEKLMPHLHLPVQSGSSAVLAAMGREHTREEYLELVHRLRTARPGLVLTTDILVGFPGEQEQDLEQTLSLLREVRFQTAYMYRYSERAGTRAAHRLPDTVSEEEKLRRLQQVIDLQEQISREVLSGWIGRTVEVLVDGPSRRDPQAAQGRTPENVPCVVQGAGSSTRCGSLLEGRVSGSTGHTLIAAVQEGPAAIAPAGR